MLAQCQHGVVFDSVFKNVFWCVTHHFQFRDVLKAWRWPICMLFDDSEQNLSAMLLHCALGSWTADCCTGLEDRWLCVYVS